MQTNIHVHGLQDGRRVVLRPSDIVCTPFFVVAQHHRQSVSVDCFPVLLGWLPHWMLDDPWITMENSWDTLYFQITEMATRLDVG